MPTPNFGLEYIAEGQGQPHVTHNENMDRLDELGLGGGGGGGGARVASPSGATLELGVADATLALAGPSVTAAGLIPTRAIVLGVSTRTVAAVTGAASYQCGLGPGESQFGGALGAAVGSSNIGVVGPFATYAPTDVVLTAEGGDFTGGEVIVSASYIKPALP
jgi:hypothetical protein